MLRLALLMAPLALFRGCAGGMPVSGPAAAPTVPPPFRLVDQTTAKGIDFRHAYGSRSPITIVEAMGGGAAVIDYDGDGWPDLFLISSGQDFQKPTQTPGCKLYHNRGDGTFEDVTQKAGIAIDGYAMGCCIGDFDNDGRPDLFVTGFARNFLLRNRADGTFEDVTKKAGILQRPHAWGTGCAFVDINRDGLLDLYVGNYVQYDPKVPLCHTANVMSGCTPAQYHTQANELYLNRGDGTFQECAAARGATDPAGASLGVVVSDVDGDGWPDLFIANDGTPNALLHNLHGKFEEIAVRAGVAFGDNGTMRAGMGVDAADYDGDGRVDLVVTNFFHEPNSLFHNQGGLIFDERATPSGMGGPSIMRLKFGVAFVDLNGDGKLDLYEGNGHVYDNVAQFSDTATFEELDQAMLNVGNGRFTEVQPSSGAFPEVRSVTRGVAVGDFNNDGAPDIITNNLGRPARLLMNQPPVPLHWLGLKLEGTRSNRSAIGARVELRGPDGLQVREVRSGGSYISQSDLRVLFGLGAIQQADQLHLRIRWPNGAWQNVQPHTLNQYLTVREEAGAA